MERVPADTWKIVETSHEAEFVLSQVYHFPHELFQQYCQVGYRGLQKGFNVEVGLITFSFIIEYEVVCCFRTL